MSRKTDTFEEIILDIQAGRLSGKSFRPIFHRYYPALLGFFRKRGFPEADSADLAQDSFLNVIQSIGTFRGTSSFETWLFQIALNVYRNELRKRQSAKRSGLETTIDELWESGLGEAANSLTDTGATNPLENTLDRERAEALDRLPSQMRHCITLRLHQDLKYREIAAVLNISIEAVKAHLYQARRRLRDDLISYFTETEPR